MSDFELELKAAFLEEASQSLGDAEQCFLSLENNPGDPALIEKIFRLAHNLKGSSKAVGFDELGKFTHTFESFLLKIKNREIPVVPETVGVLLQCNDHIRAIVDGLRRNMSASFDSSELSTLLQSYLTGDRQIGQNEAAAVDQTPTDFSDVERLLALPLESQMSQAQARPPAPPQPKPQQLQPAPAAAPGPAAATLSSSPDESIRVSLSRLERLMNFVGEMVILQTVLREQTARGEDLELVRKTVHQLGKVTKDVQDLSLSLRMLPLKQTFQKLQRIIRDTSSLLGKKVELSTAGEDAELDKTVLDHLSDPLVHIVRNAVDHGIETPAAREAAGKGPAGRLWLTAAQVGDKFVVEIKDDGAGIDANRLRQKALEKGILRPGQVISDQEAIHLIFHAGFSTKTEVSEVSGRGVGMDVVRTNIEALGGEVFVETALGKGSTFRIVLPLTLAIIDAMIVRVANDRFVVPLAHIAETTRPDPNALQKSVTIGEILLLRGENLPVFRLRSLLGWRSPGPADSARAEEGDQIALIIRPGNSGPFAVLVDDVIGRHQVVVKKLGDEMRGLLGFTGSAILGDGKPSLILELAEIVKASARHTNTNVRGTRAA